jgi:hypothetical protein
LLSLGGLGEVDLSEFCLGVELFSIGSGVRLGSIVGLGAVEGEIVGAGDGGVTSSGTEEGQVDGEGEGVMVGAGDGAIGVIEAFGRGLGGATGLGLGAITDGRGVGLGVSIGVLQPRIWLL